MLSVKVLMVGDTWRKSLLYKNWGSGSSDETAWRGLGELGGGGLGLVHLTP